MKTNLFLVALPSHDSRSSIAQHILACETKRSPLIRTQWTHTNDLHVILGNIHGVSEKDVKPIALHMASISEITPFLATGGGIRVYGDAVILRLEPHHRFLAIHKKMDQKLLEATQNTYHFHIRSRYDPHLLLGRIQNVQALNFSHKKQLIDLAEKHFSDCSFLVQQAALIRRTTRQSRNAALYETVQPYPLQGKKSSDF